MEIIHYLRPNGKDPYQDWLNNITDQKARVTIDRRIERVTNGNFGDHKFCDQGVWELRIDTGPGYRVYYAQQRNQIVILLAGGTKKSQQKDIETAIEYLEDFKRIERETKNATTL